MLGIGEWRLLYALGIKPEACHLNEGHAAFAVLERARAFMEETGQPFEVALAATRAVREYTVQHYIPAATAYRQRADNKGAKAAQLVNWQHDLEKNWSNIRFGEMKVGSQRGEYVFSVQVYLNGLDPNTLRVELYADGVNGGEPVRQEMRGCGQLAGANGHIYSAQVSATRPATDYTARVIPHRSSVAIPLEAARILWQR